MNTCQDIEGKRGLGVVNIRKEDWNKRRLILALRDIDYLPDGDIPYGLQRDAIEQ